MKRILTLTLMVLMTVTLISVAYADCPECSEEGYYTAVPNECGGYDIYDDRYDHVPPVMVVGCAGTTTTTTTTTTVTTTTTTTTACTPIYQYVSTACCAYNTSIRTSAQWARCALRTLTNVLEHHVPDWTITRTKLHVKTANGWTELWLRNRVTGEELYCVMNLYTHRDMSCHDNHRYIIFTYEHLCKPGCGRTGLKFAEYPDEYLITPFMENGHRIEMADGLTMFIEWLMEDIDHSMPI